MFYLLNKPKGITSFKAINDFARENKIQKIGHTGTLDPLASGLLLVATDEDTKLIEFVDKGFKTYKATMMLGKVSDTYDIEGIVEQTNAAIPSIEEVEKALMKFLGKQEQLPPAFSAKKINGQKAYDLAREGKEVNLKPSLIEITEIKDFTEISKDTYSFEVTVSRGTYIRSIIHDLGKNLGCGALMSDLVRTSIGKHNLSEQGTEVNILDLLTLPILKSDKMTLIKNSPREGIEVPDKDGVYALEYQNDIFGIVEVKQGILRPLKLIGNKFRKVGL